MKPNDFLLTPDWPAPPGVHAASTLRSGGVSTGPYAGLNMALHVGDCNENVAANRRLVYEALSLPSEPVWLQQVHSNRVVKAQCTVELQQADAAYTDQPGVVCAVMTADCLPLLLCSSDGQCVAAIHAGWRGLLAGIIGNTVNALGSRDIMAWLGPAIGPASFEVGSEVRDAFLAGSARAEQAFRPNQQGKWLADLYRLAAMELAEYGIDQVYGGRLCTFTDAARFYSYRRDAVTGRMATLIWRD